MKVLLNSFNRMIDRTSVRSGGPRIALIADELTMCSLGLETPVANITRSNYKWILRFWRPDFLLVESAWNGLRENWKYGIASYPNKPKSSNDGLRRVVDFAREKGIPSIFWNKEDGAHFDRFIDSARIFDQILTVDENCIPKYRRSVPGSTSVGVMMFPVQHRIHNFAGFQFDRLAASFVGSYSRQMHDGRRRWQDMMFQACDKASLPLVIYDRNSGKGLDRYSFPTNSKIELHPAVSYADTADLYRKFSISLNVNTVDDSPSMYSRRLVEILACGGIAVTNPAPSIDLHFKDFCYTVSDKLEADETLSRLKYGPSKLDLERARAGAAHIRENFTWEKRLPELCSFVSS